MNRKTAFLICSTVLLSTNISILTRIHADEKQTAHTSKIVDGKEESFTDETIESNTVDTSVICNQNGGTVTINKNTLHKIMKTVKMQLYLQQVLPLRRLINQIYRVHQKEAVVLLQMRKQWYMQMTVPS